MAQGGLWRVLNSHFALWCLSAFFLSFLGWCYDRNVEEGRRAAEIRAAGELREAELRTFRQDLNLEITFRVQRADAFLTLAQSPDLVPKPRERLDNLAQAVAVLSGEDPVFARFGKSPLVGLVHALRSSYQAERDSCGLPEVYEITMRYSRLEPTLRSVFQGSLAPDTPAFKESLAIFSDEIWPYFVREWHLPSGTIRPGARTVVDCVEESVR